MMWKVIAGVVVFGAVAFAAMSFIPETREGRASIELQALPEKIVDVLRDVQGQPSWRRDIKEIKLLENGWIEINSRGEEIRFRWISLTRERGELNFSSQAGYSGTWVAILSPTASGTRMEVVECVTISNPMFRLIARLFFDPAAFAQSYLNHLKARVES
jgi:hypothetical protein